jgi:hypothetical protein
LKKILTSLLLLVLSFAAQAQFVPFVPNQILTAQQLNYAFSQFLPLTGGTLTGPLVVPSITVGGVPFTPSGFTGTGNIVLQNNPTILNPVISGASISGSTGAFTNLSSSGTVSGAGFSSYLASPPSIGSTAPSTGAFTTLSATTSATFTGATTAATTQGRLDNSTQFATDQFVNQQGSSATATVPFAGVTGGTYNQATLGTGAQVVVFTSSGVVTSIPTIANPGSGYAVGDLVALPAGNSDAVLRVTGVSGGGVTTFGIAYGGTGYTTGVQVTAMPVPPGRRAVVFTGTLTSNLTFIIQNGAFLTASREVEFINNTTGAFTTTVKLSNGSGGSTGTGVVLAQGTNDSSALTVYTDGVNDVWIANTPLGIGALTSTNPVLTSGLTVSYSSAAMALNDTSGTGQPAYLLQEAGANRWQMYNSTANAWGVGRFVSGTFTDTPISVSNSTGIASFVDGISTANAALTGGSITGMSGSFTTLAASGTITPSQTAGIVGTTTNNNANAGSVGEYQSPGPTSSTGITSGTNTNITSETLTAGDWDVQCTVQYTAAGTTVVNNVMTGISTSSATFGTVGTFAQLQGSLGTGTANTQVTPTVRLSLASSTPTFCVGFAGFTTSTMITIGLIRARRVR